VQFDLSQSHLLELLAGGINAHLLPELLGATAEERARLAGLLTFRFDRKPRLSPEEARAQATADQTDIQSGVATINSVRARRGEPLVEGGDIVLLDNRGGGLIPLATLVAQAEAAAAGEGDDGDDGDDEARALAAASAGGRLARKAGAAGAARRGLAGAGRCGRGAAGGGAGSLGGLRGRSRGGRAAPRGPGGAVAAGDPQAAQTAEAAAQAALGRFCQRWETAHARAVGLCARALGDVVLPEAARAGAGCWSVARSLQQGVELALAGWGEDRRARGRAALEAAPSGAEAAPAGADALGLLLAVGREVVDCHAGGLLQDAALAAVTTARAAEGEGAGGAVVWMRVQASAAAQCGCEDVVPHGEAGPARCRAGCVYVPQVLEMEAK